MRNIQPTAADRLPASSELRLRPHTPGEMALQSFTNLRASESAPQMLVQLVGYRDPTAGAGLRRGPPGAKSETVKPA